MCRQKGLPEGLCGKQSKRGSSGMKKGSHCCEGLRAQRHHDTGILLHKASIVQGNYTFWHNKWQEGPPVFHQTKLLGSSLFPSFHKLIIWVFLADYFKAKLDKNVLKELVLPFFSKQSLYGVLVCATSDNPLWAGITIQEPCGQSGFIRLKNTWSN